MKKCYCCVYGCLSKIVKNQALTFHSFPKRKSSYVYVTNEHGVEVKMDRKKVWEMILLMRKPASTHQRVCSLHFQNDDYYLPGYMSKKLKLRNHVVPTLNLPQKYRKEKPESSQHCASSLDKSSPDYAPSINLGPQQKLKIEEVNLDHHSSLSELSEIATNDPLSLESLPDCQHVKEEPLEHVIEESIKVEPVDFNESVKVEVESVFEEHSYCK